MIESIPKSFLARSTVWAASVCLFSLPTTARGDFVTHSVLQAVNSDGGNAYVPGPGPLSEPISITGVVINNPGDMLNYNSGSSSAWQVFFQATAADDYGGTALYMRKSVPWLGQVYTDEEWANEMARVNYPNGLGSSPLQRGDLITVTAKAPGMFFNGKYNINEQHMTSFAYDFTISVISSGNTLSAAAMTLASLKSTTDEFLFDATRATGCEHYQGGLVHFDNLVLDNPGDWALDGTVTVSQGDLTFPMKLGLDPGLLSANPGSNLFGVTAILDQESSNFAGGYRLWLTNASDLSTVPEPSSLVLLAVAGGGQCVWFLRRKLRGRA